MGRVAMMLASAPTLPSANFVKIAALLQKREILQSMEKTAEVSEKLHQRGGDILVAFYKEARELVPAHAENEHVKIAQSMIVGGASLFRAIDFTSPVTPLAPVLEKLATAGVVNYRLALAIAEPSLSDEGKAAAYKLASENNAHMLELLSEVVKTAGEPSQLIGGARMSPESAANKIVSGFGSKGSGSSGGSGSGFLGKVKNFFSGDGGANAFNKSIAGAVNNGGVSQSAVSSGYKSYNGSK